MRIIFIVFLLVCSSIFAKDCNFQSSVKNGKTVSKSEPLKLQGDKASVYFTFMKTDTLANLMAMSWDEDISFVDCDLIIKFKDNSNITVKYNNFSNPEMFIDLTPETFGFNEVHKVFEKNSISEINFFNKKKRKTIVKIKLSKSNSTYITNAFYCFTKP